ncbi:hypothetical protein [Luteimonas sp. 100069]|uniref:hypothetical protein n=1 Tax=Luteimonas sp. 100069 TaxID=2006109 RepID=UPI000F9813E7|nr:hypothetical protein [Luteimonas sp. 100069]RPD85169.1 hypothetical protein EGK76_09595 [Luteimonas sp. 100069]
MAHPEVRDKLRESNFCAIGLKEAQPVDAEGAVTLQPAAEGAQKREILFPSLTADHEDAAMVGMHSGALVDLTLEAPQMRALGLKSGDAVSGAIVQANDKVRIAFLTSARNSLLESGMLGSTTAGIGNKSEFFV